MQNIRSSLLIINSTRLRIALVAGGFLIYGLAYLPLRAEVSIAAGFLSIIPLILSGWIFGLWGGLTAGLLIIILHTILLRLAGYPGWDTALLETYGIGPVVGIITGTLTGYWSDLTKTLQYQNNTIRESERRYYALFEQTHDAVFVFDLHGNHIDANQRAVSMLGYSLDQLLKLSYRDVSAEPTKSDHILERLLDGEQIPLFERMLRKANGELLPTEITVELVRDNQGNPAYILSVARDITERKRIEESLSQSEKRFRSFIETTPSAVTITDPDGKVIFVNQQSVAMHGYDSVQEMLGIHLLDFVCPASRESMYKAREMAQQGNIIRDMEVCLRRKDGSEFPAEVSIAMESGAEGQPRAYVGILHDITERSRIDSDLRKLSHAVEQTNASIVITDKNGRIEYVNPFFSSLTGYSTEDAIGRNPNILKSGLTPASVYKDLWITITDGRDWSGEFCNKKKNGEFYWEFASISPVKDKSGAITHYIAVKTDITERKRNEQALRESEQRFSVLSSAAFEGIVVSDGGQIIDANEQIASMLGYKRSELISSTVDKFVAPESLELVEQHLQSGNEGLYEHLALRKDGSAFPVEIRARSLPYKGRIVRVSAILDLSERKHVEAELRQRASEFAALYETASNLASQHELPVLLNAIVERARNLLQASSGGMYLYDPNENDLEMVLDVSHLIPAGTRLAMGEGMAGRVAQTRQPLIVDDYHKWEGIAPGYNAIPFRSVIQVPMLYSGELIGVLVVYELGASERKFTKDDERLLSLFSEFAASAVHATRLLQKTRRQAQETSALLETSLALNSLDLQSTLQTLSNHAKSLFDSDGCRIFLVEPDGETLRCVIAVQDNPEAFSSLRLKIGEGVTGAVAASGKSEIVNDMLNDPRGIQVQGTPEEPEAIMFAPLKERDRIIGILSVRRAGWGRPFQPADLNLLEAFASLATSAVSNGNLLQETQRRLQRLSALRQIDQVITSNLELHVTTNIILDQIIQQLEVDAAAVLIYQPEMMCLVYLVGQGFHTQALQFTTLNIGQGFAGRAALEQKIVHIADIKQIRTAFLYSLEFREENFVDYIGVPLIVKGNLNGVLEIYQRRAVEHDREWMEYLRTLAGQVAIAIENNHLFVNLQSSNLQLSLAYDNTIEGWAKALELRDMETVGHSQRTVDLTLKLAHKLGIGESQMSPIRRGALLHDIGKMGVPDSILQKPSTLNEGEWDIMRKHPIFAYQWLEPIAYLKPALDIPYCHHERWDGTGYPRGLRGEEIPIGARIFTVVDVWDALSSDRPYRSAWSEEDIIQYLKDQAGKQFDPKVVDVFLMMLEEVKRAEIAH